VSPSGRRLRNGPAVKKGKNNQIGFQRDREINIPHEEEMYHDILDSSREEQARGVYLGNAIIGSDAE